MSALTGKQRRTLRALAHPRKPIVLVGQRGVTQGLLLEADRALTDHELIKVKISSESPVGRREAAEAFAGTLGCEVVGRVGRVLVLYRPHPEKPRIQLPAAPAGRASDAPQAKRGDEHGTL